MSKLENLQKEKDYLEARNEEQEALIILLEERLKTFKQIEVELQKLREANAKLMEIVKRERK